MCNPISAPFYRKKFRRDEVITRPCSIHQVNVQCAYKGVETFQFLNNPERMDVWVGECPVEGCEVRFVQTRED